MRKGPSWFNVMSVAAGLAFLYLPIVLLVIFSFNGGRLVTVWGGFSTRWYGRLMQDDQMLESAWITARLGLISATAATVLGTMAAIRGPPRPPAGSHPAARGPNRAAGP